MVPGQASAAPSSRTGYGAALAPFVIALALLLALAGCSDGRGDVEAEEYPSPSPLLYEIANSHGEVEGWLFGTIHALPDGAAWRIPAVDSVVDEADLLIVEVAELDNSRDISAIFGRLSVTPDLPPISQRVSSPLRGDLETMIGRSDFDEGSFTNIENWAAAIMLSQVDAVGRPRNGVDRALIRQFAGRPVRGFETAEEQLRIFDTLAPADQTDLLEGTVREWAKARENPGRLTRAWLIGDLATLEETTTSGIMADPELREALLVGRNERWFAELVPILEGETKPLVAVGTAHIVGPDGLPAMLEALGYTITRLE